MVVLSYIFEMESGIVNLNDNTAATLRYLLAVKCIMYILVFVAD